MRKLIIISSVAIVLVLLCAAAYFFIFNGAKNDNQGAVSSSASAAPSVDLTIDSAISKFTAAGLNVSEKKPAYYQTIGATNGAKYDINATNIELYEFADKTKLDAASNKLTNASNLSFSVGHLLILAHTTDQDFVTEIQKALK